MRSMIRKYKNALEKEQKEEAQRHLEQAKALKKELQTIPYSNPMDSTYKRLTYVRYADDFTFNWCNWFKGRCKIY